MKQKPHDNDPLELLDCSRSIAEVPWPPEVERFVRAADERRHDFVSGLLEQPPSGFLSSDPARAYATLRWLREELPGRPRFLEWGSGLGLVTCLAACLGFESYGIEVQERFVREAERLAQDFGLPARFVHGSLLPPEVKLDAPEEPTFLSNEGPDPYPAIGHEVKDFDVVYVFPWPAEEGLLRQVFARTARPGAWLVTYEEVDRLRLLRKLPFASRDAAAARRAHGTGEPR